MNWEKEYIVQTYENAAGNLRLVSDRLINHTLMKEFISDCEKIEAAVNEMKKVTEFAKFAVKLGGIIDFTRTVPNFIDLSAEMTKQINDLIPIVREMLDEFKPEEFSVKLGEIRENLFAKNNDNSNVPNTDNVIEVVNLIRKIDDYLNLCAKGEISSDDKEKFMEIVNRMNALLAPFENPLVLEMKEIFNALFGNIISKGFSEAEEIEAMRACLIVIVAKLKNKDVDVSQFIELARNVATRKEEK